jgi:hypothetical protein
LLVQFGSKNARAAFKKHRRGELPGSETVAPIPLPTELEASLTAPAMDGSAPSAGGENATAAYSLSAEPTGSALSEYQASRASRQNLAEEARAEERRRLAEKELSFDVTLARMFAIVSARHPATLRLSLDKLVLTSTDLPSPIELSRPPSPGEVRAITVPLQFKGRLPVRIAGRMVVLKAPAAMALSDWLPFRRPFLATDTAVGLFRLSILLEILIAGILRLIGWHPWARGMNSLERSGVTMMWIALIPIAVGLLMLLVISTMQRSEYDDLETRHEDDPFVGRLKRS